MSSAENKPYDWRIRAEAKRKAALEIRARNDAKRLKEATEQRDKTQAVAITPATKAVNPYKMSNPCAKTSPAKGVNPYAKSNKTPTKNKNAAMSAQSPVAATAVTPKPQSEKKVTKVAVSSKPPPPRPQVTSQWGDCRMDLWEQTCTCGGERKAPDVRMCSCLAWLNAGLGCDGCNAGCLLIKSGPRGNFWGCSMYKKKGCKFSRPFGHPHDAEAARKLADIKQSSMRRAMKVAEEQARIRDPFELDWRSVCRCDGAKSRDTFECFMRSNGGCGMLPICPKGCGGQLFLHASKYGKGRWWGCSNYKNGMCQFKKDYIEHR